MYEPKDGSDPYAVVSVSGRIYRSSFNSPYGITDLSAAFSLTNPPTVDYGYMCQAEEFLVIQAGDGVTLPLFWDGVTLRRSAGISRAVGVVDVAGFVAPALNAAVNVPLTGTYTGTHNQIIMVGTAKYMQVNRTDYAAIQNISEPAIGASIPAGTAMYNAGTGSQIGTVLVPFVIPALAGSVNIFNALTSSGPFPMNVLINGNQWVLSPFLGPLPNDVLLVNLTDSPAATHVANELLLSVPEIPAATAMDYFQGRLWYAQGRNYSAGDIVGGPSGTSLYNLRDSVLKLTENPLCIGGDGFTVPSNAGNIRAIKHTANINSQLGQGSLYIFTRKTIYSQTVPVTRTDWIGADTNNQPRQEVVQLVNGAVNDRSIVAVNGDLFYQSLEPAIRSLSIAVRNFQQWGNKPISSNEDRALQFTNRSLMRFASGIEFQNRLWQAILPRVATDGINVVSQAIAPLDFDIISSLDQTLPPAWEGMYEGLQILQLFTGDFGGRDRAFALAVSSVDNSLEMWELTIDQRFENGDNRISWYFETPAFAFDKEFEWKKLVGGNVWLDKVFGTVEMDFYYRPDASPCWQLWHHQTLCVSRNCTEDVHCPSGYPLNFREGYKFAVTLPEPPAPCNPMGVEPLNIGNQFQMKVAIKGWCRVRGFLLYATQFDKSVYAGLTC